MLHLLYSDNVNNLKEDVLNRVSNLSKTEEEIYLVVPEMFTYSSELQVMDFLNVESMINIKVMSFQRMTETILSKIGGIKRQRIDDVGKALIIRRLMNENPQEYKLYRGMIDKEGFYSKLIALIKEFKNNLIEPGIIDGISDCCETDLLKEKLKEISLIYAGIDKYLQNKYVDNEDRLNQLLEVLEYSDIFKNKTIIFWQFSGFSQLEYNIISSILKMGAEVTVGLVFDDKKDIRDFEITKRTKNKLIEIINQLDISCDEEQIKTTIFEPEYAYVVSNTIEEEINMVAGRIRLLLDNKTKYNEIALIPASEEYSTRIKRIFAEYNIPVLINDKEPLITTAVASWIRNMFNVVLFGFKYEDVISFLKSRLNIFKLEEVQVFENYVLRKNIRGEMYFREKYFAKENFVNDAEEYQVKLVRKYIIEGFSDIKRIRTSKFPLKLFVEKFFGALKSFNFISMIDNFLDELEEEGLLKEVEIVEQSYSAIVDIIDQMIEILDDTVLDLQEFLSLIESGFKQKSLGAIPQGSSQVLISSVKEGLSGDFQYVFFLGATSENIPKAKKFQSLLSEDELKELSVGNIGINTRDTLDLEESHNLYKLLTLPKKMSMFSYSKFGLDGRKQKPSTYIKDYNAKLQMEESSWEFRLDPMLYSLSDTIREYVEYGRIEDEKIKLLKQAKATKLLEKKLSVIIKDNSLEKPDFKIDKAKARLLYKEPLELSVTRIHQMSKCEFAHFIKYGLSPKEREVATIEPKEMGTLLHGFVEDFSKEVKENPNLIDISDEKKICDIVDRIYENRITRFLDTEDLESYRNTYLLKKLKRSANTLGKLLIEQIRDSEFKLFGQEVYFGKNCDLPEIDLSDENYSAWIKGQIDRVDIYEEDGKQYIRIIDYKSNGKSFSLSDNYNTIDVQLLLYMSAALLSNENTSPAGAFYLPLLEKQLSIEDTELEKITEKRKESYKMDGLALSDENILQKMDKNFNNKESTFKLKGRGSIEERNNLLSEKEFIGLVDHVKLAIKSKLNDLFEGDVRINPYIKENNDSGCKFCNYRGICGFDEKLNKERLKKLSEYDILSIKKIIGGDK